MAFIIILLVLVFFIALLSSLFNENHIPTARRSRGVEVKSLREIEIMRNASKIVVTILSEIAKLVEPGISTFELDKYAESKIREMGAIPSFKGYHGFPTSTCITINNEVANGIPQLKRILKEGDLLKVDIAVFLDGYHVTSSTVIYVGSISEKAKKLSTLAKDAFYAGLSKIKPGNSLIDVAGAIEDLVHNHGYSVVEDYTGYGIGRSLHEEPSVFNFRTNELPNITFREGMTLVLYPLINEGSKSVKTLRDTWTVVTKDGGLSVGWKHTIVVTKDGAEILTE